MKSHLNNQNLEPLGKKEAQAILDAVKQIEKKFGKESIMVLGDKSSEKVETISSGSLIVDDLLGIGGYPKGRIIEIFGPESSGKTTLALHAIAEVQKNKGICAYIDAEHAIDPKYAENLGIKTEDLILSQPESGEQALEIVDQLTKTGCIDLIVVDSVAALVPESELKGEMTDQSIGLQARLMSKGLRKITGNLNKNNTTIIFINQIREKVGVYFGNPETTPGGRALKFYSSIRMEVRKSGSIIENNETVGISAKIKITKNKIASPFKVGKIDILFSKGIDKMSEILDFAEKTGIVNKKGTWYSFEGKNFAQGKANAVTVLEQEKAMLDKILEQLNPKIKPTKL